MTGPDTASMAESIRSGGTSEPPRASGHKAAHLDVSAHLLGDSLDHAGHDLAGLSPMTALFEQQGCRVSSVERRAEPGWDDYGHEDRRPVQGRIGVLEGTFL